MPEVPRTESVSADRKRKVRLRLRPTWRYSLRWDDLDGVTGESGHGLRNCLRTWWQVRRGTWRDDFSWDEDSEDAGRLAGASTDREPSPARQASAAAPALSLACECEHRSNEYKGRRDGYWHCSDCDGRVEDICLHEYEYLEREPGETYTGFCEKCIKCGDIVQVPQ